MSTPAGCLLRLPKELTLPHVSDLRKRWLGEIKGAAAVHLNLRDVSQVDAAGLQLLLSLVLHCRRAGIEVAATGAQEEFVGKVRRCGAEAVLGFVSQGDSSEAVEAAVITEGMESGE